MARGDGPWEIPRTPEGPLRIPAEPLEGDQAEIEIAAAEAERDRQQDRGGRGERDPAGPPGCGGGRCGFHRGCSSASLRDPAGPKLVTVPSASGHTLPM